ncbi:response regulator transcription factor [Acidovorax sp. SRB_24]|uniref:response regulator n=1 Tax=Acidovorax sp. SRB_24 TaxID=1962700 RepID=UPI00145F7D54|nr:response regulator transcription factor [Acidovorax sp. SRB_24]NMM78345.1 DNA-binding response regulator [Acidovorax sp. SRB_24]
MIQVVLCDDHALVRRGIRDTLEEAPDIQVTGEAGSYSELREVLRGGACEVLLLDLNLPGRSGLEVLASVRETHPEIKVLVVSMYPEDQYAVRCLRAGAQGYANKASDPVELVAAVRTLVQGRKYLTAEVAQMLAHSVSEPESESAHAALSERELQTLLKIATGKRLSDIAEELMLSPKTVSVYRSRVLEKLKLTNNAELTVYAIRNELV